MVLHVGMGQKGQECGLKYGIFTQPNKPAELVALSHYSGLEIGCLDENQTLTQSARIWAKEALGSPK